LATVKTVLGFDVDEINRILDYLYPALANEIQQPKKQQITVV